MSSTRVGFLVVLGCVLFGGLSPPAAAQCFLADALHHQRIASGDGGFDVHLGTFAGFARSCASLGDFDGDGVGDVAVPGDGLVWLLYLRPDGTVKDYTAVSPPGGTALANLGDLDGDGTIDLAAGAPSAVWILFLCPDGSLKASQQIDVLHGGFTGQLDDGDLFGISTASLGDLDGDGIVDLAVGASGDDDGGENRGAVWILFLRANGTVKAQQKISATEGLFTGALEDGDRFGAAVAGLGDVDGDGVVDVAVGAPDSLSNGGAPAGTVWLLALKTDGTVSSHVAIFPGGKAAAALLDGVSTLGKSLAAPGDEDGDGVPDLAAGARSSGTGSVCLLDLTSDGTLHAARRLGPGQGGFMGQPNSAYSFGWSVALLDDLDGDGFRDLAIGNPGVPMLGIEDDLWIVFPDDGAGESPGKISLAAGGFAGPLGEGDSFGSAVAVLGTSAAGGIEVAVGAPWADVGANDTGAVWWLSLGTDGLVLEQHQIEMSLLTKNDHFGAALAGLGDFDGDGFFDLAVSAPDDDDGLLGVGTTWVHFLGPGGTVRGSQKIGNGAGGFEGELDPLDHFGCALALVGDVDGDGLPERAVGARGDDDGGSNRGALWLLFLHPDGTVRNHVKISDTSGGFEGALADGDRFGFALAALGDLDGDRVPELAVGAPGDDGEGVNRGAVWLLFLRRDGTVARERRIAPGESGFVGVLSDVDNFGAALSGVGDLDGNGVPDLAVGAPFDDGGSTDLGALWLLFLRPDGTVASHQKYGVFPGGSFLPLGYGDQFASGLSWAGDLNGDGIGELLVGAPGDDDGGPRCGAVWRLCLNPGRWQDLGHGLSGTGDPPRLTGQGTLAPSSTVTLSLAQAPRHALVALVAGLHELQAPFQGGLLVPAPDLVLTGLATEGSGQHVVQGRWPPDLPADTRIWAQFWIVDAGGPQGFAASNAVVGTAP